MVAPAALTLYYHYDIDALTSNSLGLPNSKTAIQSTFNFINCRCDECDISDFGVVQLKEYFIKRIEEIDAERTTWVTQYNKTTIDNTFSPSTATLKGQ